MFLAYCTSLNGFDLTRRSILWPHLDLEIERIWFNLIGDLDLLNWGLQYWNHGNVHHLHLDAVNQETQERCRFSNTRIFTWKVKSKMHKFNSRNVRIPGSAWQTPKQKKECKNSKKKKQLKRVDAIKEMCLITFHSLHS